MLPYDPDGVQKNIFAIRLTNGSNDNMAVDGSDTSVEFEIAPPSDEIWRVASWTLYIEDQKGFNITSYGANGALTNGMLIQGTFGGVTSNMLSYPIKTNGNIAATTNDVKLFTFGNDNDVLTAKWDFTSSGQFVRLDGSQGDKLTVVVRDDMTFLSKQHILANGYKE